MYAVSRGLTTNNNLRFYDVIVAGGGLIGTTMACSLAKQSVFKDRSIALIEATPYTPYEPTEKHSNRVSALNQLSKALLTELGIWKNLNRFSVVKDMKVWGTYSNNFSHFVSSENEELAYVVENDEIVNAATMELKKLPNVDVLYGARVKSINLHTDIHSGPDIELSREKEKLTCDLLIGADGPYSKIREAMKVNQISWSYDQVAIVASLHLDNKEQVNTTAWQRFLPEGPIALLPLSDNTSSLVWSTTPERGQALMGFTPAQFVQEVNDALLSEPRKDNVVEFLSNATDVVARLFPALTVEQLPLDIPKVIHLEQGSRGCFPLAFSHAAECTIPRVVIIGDAAHKVHPLAGQGVNLGFRDVKSLTDILSDGLVNGRKLGDGSDLKLYEALSQTSNVPILAAIDLLHRIYTSNINLVKAFGNFGFQLTEIFPTVKEVMKKFASR